MHAVVEFGFFGCCKLVKNTGSGENLPQHFSVDGVISLLLQIDEEYV